MKGYILLGMLGFILTTALKLGYDVTNDLGVVGSLRLAGVSIPTKIVKEQVEVPVEVVLPEKSFEEELTEQRKSFGIPAIFIEALLDKECQSRSMRCVKSEAHNSRQLAIARKFSSNAEEQRMIASSYCPFQVMGYNAYAYDRDWTDLLTPKDCVFVGLSLFKDCWERSAKHKDANERVARTGACYNGSGEMAERYGRDFLQRVQEASLEMVMNVIDNN